MNEFELMSNGNIKFLGISLGTKFLDACKKLSNIGLTIKKEEGYSIKDGYDSRIRFSTSLSFAKSCGVELWSDYTGRRIEAIIIHGDANKDISSTSIMKMFEEFAKENKLHLDGKSTKDGNLLFSVKSELVEIELQVPVSKVGIISIWIKFIKTFRFWKVDKYEYNEIFINELYINYLEQVSRDNSRKPKLGIKKIPHDASLVFKVILVICAIVLSFIIANSYRYDTFKDKNKYMRYDNWTETYEKYDISSGEWKSNF